jgi:cytochrome c553
MSVCSIRLTIPHAAGIISRLPCAQRSSRAKSAILVQVFGVMCMSFRHAIAFAALVGAGLVQAADAPVAFKPGDATAGQAKAATCGACHGVDGNPASSQYPKLAGQGEDYVARQVDLIKTNKRPNPVMLPFVSSMSVQDMHDVGAYFFSKASLPGIADAKYVARGEALYRGGDSKAGIPACMACHGPDGRGNPGAVYPQLAGQYADYVSAKLKGFRDGKGFSDDDRGKIMPVVAKGLSDDDIAAISSYIEGLHAASSATAAK